MCQAITLHFNSIIIWEASLQSTQTLQKIYACIVHTVVCQPAAVRLNYIAGRKIKLIALAVIELCWSQGISKEESEQLVATNVLFNCSNLLEAYFEIWLYLSNVAQEP